MTCFSVDTRVVPFFFFRLRPISSSHRAHFLVRGWHPFALFCFSWSAARHAFFAMSGGWTFRNDFSTRTRCWRTRSAAFLDRTTASSASLRLPQSVISGTSVGGSSSSLCCSLSFVMGYSSSSQKQTQNRIFLYHCRTCCVQRAPFRVYSIC